MIGRNEGTRLLGCLNSLRGLQLPMVYVDSGSSDGSQAAARDLGADVVDLDLSAPFTAARARNVGFRRLCSLHPDLEFVSLVIPQVPGTIRRSRPIRGIAESVIKAKKYVIPLAFFQPYVAGSFAAAYLVDGQFKPTKNAMGFNPRFFEASVAVGQLGSEVSMMDNPYVLALSK